MENILICGQLCVAKETVLIVDIESTCWEATPPKGQQSEIIEIGVCLLDMSNGNIWGKRSILVKPVRSKVSPFCTSLTTLTQADVDKGVSFGEACAILRNEYKSNQLGWASYGEYDKNMFRRQCASFGINYPFTQYHTNVKQEFAASFRCKPMGMAQALSTLGINLVGTHHRGHDDAYNIAVILKELTV